MTQDIDTAGQLLDAARAAVAAHRLSVSGTDPKVIRLPDAATAELIQAVSRCAMQLCQVVPLPGAPDTVGAFAGLVPHQLPSEGRSVCRIYLVPFGAEMTAEMGKIVNDDRAAGIDAQVLHVGPTPDVHEPMTQLWLVDETVAVYQEYGKGGPPTWVVSARHEDVRAACERWTRLWARLEHDRSPRISEPLLESADLLHSLAKFSCTGHQVDHEGCAWYHGSWQYLRLFNMVSSPNWHAEFYELWLHRQLRPYPNPRALITGSADYAMLAFLLAAVEKPAQLDAHIVDLCLTPLLANRWLAERLGVEVTTHQADIIVDTAHLAATAGSFDLIVSDAFLTRFPPADARRVMSCWRRLLRPGGSVVTTIRQHTPEVHREGLSKEVTDYLLRFYGRLQGSHWLLAADHDDLLDAARTYALKMTSWNLGEADEILGLFTGAGFRIIHQETDGVEGELAKTEYLRVVAQA
jgi:hypothetical protein